MKRIAMDKLAEFGVTFMTKRGMPGDSAAYVARAVVETEAFRQSTHGLAQYGFINSNLGKTLDPATEPVIVQHKGATAVIDGTRALGQLAVKLATELARDIVQEHGTAFIAVRNSYWIGSLGMPLVSLARDGLLCEAWAQTNTCKDCAPFGGIDARFSTNPIALAFPTDGDPVLADFSTATMSMSGASALASSGERAATARFLDKAGHPTDDASVIRDEGSLMFMGGDTEGHKGYALSLFNEALTVLAGGCANNPEAPLHQSFALMVLDPEAFAGRDYYQKEMARFIQHLRTSRVRSGFDTVRLPGERGFAALADARANGIPLDDDKLAILGGIAADNGIEAVA